MKFSVLVVDDDPPILAAVSDILTDEGYRVLTAQNGAEALEVVTQEVPQVVLLDMRMPVMSGWTFAEEARRRGLDLHILVMTAAQDAKAWAREIHADGVVPKPFDLDELLLAVASCCRRPG